METPNRNTPSPTPLQRVEPAEVRRRINAGDTFVVNIVTTWCPDCSERQALYIDEFARTMQANGIEVLQVNVQRTRGEFISTEHEQITTQFGGHGYPRTVLIHQGNLADHNNVEVIAEATLSALAKKFITLIAQSES